MAVTELLTLLQNWKYSGHQHSQKGKKCQKNLGENRFILLDFLMRMFSLMMAETFPLLELFPLMLLMKMRCSELNCRTLASWRQTSACAICKLANTRESLEKSFGVCAGQFPNSMFGAAKAQPCFAYAAFEKGEHLLIPLFALGFRDAWCLPGERPVCYSW